METIVQHMKLLSDETRLRIAMLLYKDELCVCQLTGITGIAQPKVSKALSKMRDLNLVLDYRKEKYVYYTLKKDNKLMTTLLTTIDDDLDTYPILKEDQDRVSTKAGFLIKCCGQDK